MFAMSMWMQTLFAYVSSKFGNEEGQDFAEYAIILVLVVVIAAASLGFTGLAHQESRPRLFSGSCDN